jgi:CBS domain-containing protein
MYIVGFDARRTMHRPISLRPDQTLIEARNTMMRYNISRIVVAKQNRAVGIVTEKDIARFVYEQSPKRRLDETRLDEVMTDSVVTVDPDADLRTCASRMLGRDISSLLVVDNKKNLKGIFTKTDLASAYVEHFALEHKVYQFMTKKVVTVDPDEPVHAAIMLMRGNQISRVVATKHGRPVGILTGRDLLPLAGLLNASDRPTKRNIQSFIPAGAKAFMLVSDLMTADPICAETDSDLADAAYLMIRNGISGLPVVGAKGILAGIVTKTDVVKALASRS